MRRLFALTAVAALAGCSVLQQDPYPLPSGPPHSWQTSPQQVGNPTQGVVLYLTPRPGDRIELLGAEPIGVAAGAEVRFFFSPPVHKADGTTVLGEQLEPLDGATFSNDSTSTTPDATIGIVAEMTAHQPGRYQLTAVQLRYRVNGGKELVGEGIDTLFIICVDDPIPTSCEI